MPAEGSPVSGSTRVLSVDITPAREDDVAEALRELIAQLPDHAGILPLLDAGVSDGRPFVVTPHITAESLDVALQVYGPAAVEDAIPRVRQLAAALDLAAARGLWHGALEPQDIIVSADETHVGGLGIAPALARLGVDVPRDPRYAAPEVTGQTGGSPASDQYALAVIAHEWMFGPPRDPLDGFVPVPTLDGIDVTGMQRVFDTATDVDPARRFANCEAFVAALERCVSGRIDAPVFGTHVEPARAAPPIVAESSGTSSAELDLPLAVEPKPVVPAVLDVPATDRPRGMSAFGLVAVLVAGVSIGAGAMRLLMNSWTEAPASGSHEFTNGSVATPSSPTVVVDVPLTPPRDDVAGATAGAASTTDTAPASDAAPAAQAEAGLLVHSTPAGAVVSVDGVSYGTTPVAVRGLALGTRAVVVRRAGYGAVERQVTLTADRPSRTVEVDLVPVRSTPSPPQAARREVSRTGSLVVDSRPSGASVIVDGRVAGTTPVTLTGLPPGRRTVRIERPGYRTVTTTVDVRPGERARVAARLEGGRYEE